MATEIIILREGPLSNRRRIVEAGIESYTEEGETYRRTDRIEGDEQVFEHEV